MNQFFPFYERRNNLLTISRQRYNILIVESENSEDQLRQAQRLLDESEYEMELHSAPKCGSWEYLIMIFGRLDRNDPCFKEVANSLIPSTTDLVNEMTRHSATEPETNRISPIWNDDSPVLDSISLQSFRNESSLTLVGEKRHRSKIAPDHNETAPKVRATRTRIRAITSLQPGQHLNHSFKLLCTNTTIQNIISKFLVPANCVVSVLNKYKTSDDISRQSIKLISQKSKILSLLLCLLPVPVHSTQQQQTTLSQSTLETYQQYWFRANTQRSTLSM